MKNNNFVRNYLNKKIKNDLNMKTEMDELMGKLECTKTTSTTANQYQTLALE